MQYKIHTIPIIDAFKSDCECPFCLLKAEVSANLVSLYLGEAVMEPLSRVEVNKQGFCTEHLKELFEGENKLGLSLQISTRTDALLEKMSLPKNAKNAEKEANMLLNEIGTCIICAQADKTMGLYFATTAQLFAYENGFADIFSVGSAFCLPHYAGLLKNAACAGEKTEEYLKKLYVRQKNGMNRLRTELQGFINRFDYRSGDNGGFSKDALPRSINKISGNTLKNQI